MTGGTWTRGAVAALVLGVAQTGRAEAATLTVTDSGGYAPGDAAPFDLSVAGFDRALGTLTSVAWTLAVDHAEGTAVVSNATGQTRQPSVIGFQLFYDLAALSDSDAIPPIIFTNESFGDAPYLLGSDGLLFRPVLAPGASASTALPGYVWRLAGSTADPLGLGAGPLSSWEADSITLSIGVGVTQFSFDPLPTTGISGATATLSVTYTYDPVTGGGGGPEDPVDPVPVVPLPAGLPLMLGGLAALAVVRRRRGA